MRPRGRSQREPEIRGWRIITRHNPHLDKTVYRVWLNGDYVLSRPPEWEDFDTYDDALAFYHDKTGWQVVATEQP